MVLRLLQSRCLGIPWHELAIPIVYFISRCVLLFRREQVQARCAWSARARIHRVYLTTWHFDELLALLSLLVWSLEATIALWVLWTTWAIFDRAGVACGILCSFRHSSLFLVELVSVNWNGRGRLIHRKSQSLKVFHCGLLGIVMTFVARWSNCVTLIAVRPSKCQDVALVLWDGTFLTRWVVSLKVTLIGDSQLGGLTCTIAIVTYQ